MKILPGPNLVSPEWWCPGLNRGVPEVTLYEIVWENGTKIVPQTDPWYDSTKDYKTVAKTLQGANMVDLNNANIAFTANGKSEFVLRDQVFHLLVVYSSL